MSSIILGLGDNIYILVQTITSITMAIDNLIVDTACITCCRNLIRGVQPTRFLRILLTFVDSLTLFLGLGCKGFHHSLVLAVVDKAGWLEIMFLFTIMGTYKLQFDMHTHT